MYYDNAMIINVDIKPFIAIIGNSQYLGMMKALEESVQKNDGYDPFYIVDFIAKEKVKKPSSMICFVKMHNISLVTLDNKKDN